MDSIVKQFAVDTKFGMIASTLEDKIRIQNHLANWRDDLKPAEF